MNGMKNMQSINYLQKMSSFIIGQMDFFEYLDFDVEEDSYYKEMDKYAF